MKAALEKGVSICYPKQNDLSIQGTAIPYFHIEGLDLEAYLKDHPNEAPIIQSKLEAHLQEFLPWILMKAVLRYGPEDPVIKQELEHYKKYHVLVIDGRIVVSDKNRKTEKAVDPREFCCDVE